MCFSPQFNLCCLNNNSNKNLHRKWTPFQAKTFVFSLEAASQESKFARIDTHTHTHTHTHTQRHTHTHTRWADAVKDFTPRSLNVCSVGWQLETHSGPASKSLTALMREPVPQASAMDNRIQTPAGNWIGLGWLYSLLHPSEAVSVYQACPHFPTTFFYCLDLDSDPCSLGIWVQLLEVTFLVTLSSPGKDRGTSSVRDGSFHPTVHQALREAHFPLTSVLNKTLLQPFVSTAWGIFSFLKWSWVVFTTSHPHGDTSKIKSSNGGRTESICVAGTRLPT